MVRPRGCLRRAASVWPSDQARWTMSHADVAPPAAAGNFGVQLHGRHAPQPASSMRPLPGTDHRLAAAHTCARSLGCTPCGSAMPLMLPPSSSRLTGCQRSSNVTIADSFSPEPTSCRHGGHLSGPRLLPFETSMPGVFAVGDVRHGSVKRVAGAVGEGSVAIGLVHQYLLELERATTGRHH